MARLVIGLTGLRGSGKDTVAECMRKKHGFFSLDFTRDVLGPILEKEGRAVTRENLIFLAMAGRKKHGNGVWAGKIADLAGKREHKFTISGIRFVEEVEEFRRRFGNDFILVAVACAEKKRYERLRSRGTKGEGSMSYERFLELERAPTEAALKKTIPMADFIIDNSGPAGNLPGRVEKLLKTMMR